MSDRVEYPKITAFTSPRFPEEPIDEEAQLALIESRPNNQAYGPEDRAYLLSLVRSKQTDIDEYDALLTKHGEILRRVANALNGEPAPLSSWSHHDLGEKSEALADLALRQAEQLTAIRQLVDNSIHRISIEEIRAALDATSES